MSWQQPLQSFGELSQHESMAAHTTLAVGGMATWYFKPHHKIALCQALSLIPDEIRILPLGRGSNLLVSDQGFKGMVIDLGMLNHVEIKGRTLTAQAGSRMSKLAQTAAKAGLSGLEFMATVPGDLGGGIAMNAGAFGQQASDTCLQVDIVHRHGNEETLSKQQLNMVYRHSQIPDQAIILAASFELLKGKAENILHAMRHMRQKRSQSQPLALPNCGSVFKNPEGDYAARLIEAVGLKGKCMGDAQISNVHANFIVNHGSASSDDIHALIALVQHSVFEKFAIHLEPEVRILESVQ
ncbi:MAG: UDP-N-acetylmuramate dehydrogenase [Mariprofundaceae bacterium]|nr:UDP-N-acetylmuramate dehydrogenase [Mariprofundaceae bacterium]